MRILVADDFHMMHHFLTLLLADLQEVEIVGQTHDTDETLRSIHELRPDVVLLDIRMPGGGGIHVLQEIQKEEFQPTVIVLTNYPFRQYRKKCLEEGAKYFLDKSTEFEKVREILIGLIQRECARPTGLEVNACLGEDISRSAWPREQGKLDMRDKPRIDHNDSE